MNTCDTCKWWRRRVAPSTFGSCDHLEQTDDDEDSPYGFGVFDGEPFNSGSFRSGPKFGCVHHAPNTQEVKLTTEVPSWHYHPSNDGGFIGSEDGQTQVCDFREGMGEKYGQIIAEAMNANHPSSNP